MNKNGLLRLIIWIVIIFFVVSGVVAFITLRDKVLGIFGGDEDRPDDGTNLNPPENGRIAGAEELENPGNQEDGFLEDVGNLLNE